MEGHETLETGQKKHPQKYEYEAHVCFLSGQLRHYHLTALSEREEEKRWTNKENWGKGKKGFVAGLGNLDSFWLFFFFRLSWHYTGCSWCRTAYQNMEIITGSVLSPFWCNNAQVLAGGYRGSLCEMRPGLPHASHIPSQLQWPHHRAQLGLVAKMRASKGNLTKKWQNAAW